MQQNPQLFHWSLPVSAITDEPPESFPARVAYTARQWRRCVDQLVEPFGLTQARWLPLLHISRASSPLAQKDLAHRLGLDVSTLVRQLDALETDGLIKRQPGHDRRVKQIHLTTTGRQTVARVERVSQGLQTRVAAVVPEADMAVASRVLAQVCDELSHTSQAAADE